jgi:hypothetical protein
LKTIVRLLLAAFVIYACVQGGRAEWRHYEFKDAVEQEVRYGASKTPSQLQQRLIQLAGEHGITVPPDAVTIEKRRQQTYIALAYTEGIPLVPRV